MHEVVRLIAEQRFAEALNLLDSLPPDGQVRWYRASCQLKSGAYREAEQGFSELLAQPDWVSGVSFEILALTRLRLALSLHWQDRWVEAMQVLLPVLLDCSSREDLPGIPIQYGNLCLEQGMADHWLKLVDRLPATTRSHPVVRCTTAFACLQRGQLRRGWAEHEARFGVPGLGCPLPADVPRFTLGSDRQGNHLLVVADQGFGDMLFCLRFMSALRQHCAKLSIVGHAVITPLFDASGLFDQVLTMPTRIPESITSVLPLMSAAHILNNESPETTSLASIRFCMDQAPPWTRCMGDQLRSRPLVALNWSGDQSKESPFSFGIRGRSFPLEILASCVPSLQTCDLIAVQVGDAADQMKTSVLRHQLIPQQQFFEEGPPSFLTTAAVLQACDLVITNDTSVAHLAGVLQRPAWVVLPCHPFWQWPISGSVTPWYPSLRCFRQLIPGDWPGLMPQVEHALHRWVQEWFQ